MLDLVKAAVSGGIVLCWSCTIMIAGMVTVGVFLMQLAYGKL